MASSCSNGKFIEDRKVYEKFHHYDFESDKTYQYGLKELEKLDKYTEEEILKSKLFYYSKSFHPVNLEDYNKWLNQHSDHNDSVLKVKSLQENHKQEDTTLIGDTENMNLVEKDQQTKTKEGYKKFAEDKILVKKTFLSTEEKLELPDLSKAVDKVLSLSDVAEFIEKGLSLPGITDINIKPLEIDPNPSLLQRKLKPWEK